MLHLRPCHWLELWGAHQQQPLTPVGEIDCISYLLLCNQFPQLAAFQSNKPLLSQLLRARNLGVG